MGNFNLPLTVNDSSSGHKISKKTEDINSMMTFKVDLIDMHQTHYLENKHRSFFSRAYEILTKRYLLITHK